MTLFNFCLPHLLGGILLLSLCRWSAGFDLCLNAGSSESYEDNSGKKWESDSSFVTSGADAVQVTREAISGTDEPVIYQTLRSTSANQIEYQFRVPRGDYEVNLHFADITIETHSEGARVFDILIQGATIFRNVDIYKEVGGFAALKKTTTLSYSPSLGQSFVSIELKKTGTESSMPPVISGIELHSAPKEESTPAIDPTPTPATPAPFPISTTAVPTASCTRCSNIATPWMIKRGLDCSKWMELNAGESLTRATHCTGNYWRINNNFCQQSCYDDNQFVEVTCCNSDHPTPVSPASEPTVDPVENRTYKLIQRNKEKKKMKKPVTSTPSPSSSAGTPMSMRKKQTHAELVKKKA